MANASLDEAQLLRDWFAAQKAKAKGEYTLKDAARDLERRRGWHVYPHQVCNWMKHGKMGPATRRFLRQALSAKTPQQAG